MSTGVAITFCDGCRQSAVCRDHEPGLWLCDRCRSVQYNGGERHEACRLFEPAPAPLPGQLGLDDG